MDNENLSLNKYLQLCVAFETNPSEETDAEIHDFLNKLVVKEYLPLAEKSIYAASVLLEISDDFDSFGAAAFLEMGKLFHGLCNYAINLDNDIGMLARTHAAYDLCYKYGLADAIRKRCNEDYQRFCAYVDNASNISNAYRLIQTASLLNSAEYEKWVDAMKELKATFTPEMLKNLEGINIAGSGFTEDLVRAMAAGAIENAERESLREEQKFAALAEDLNMKIGRYGVVMPSDEDEGDIEEREDEETGDLSESDNG